VPPSGERSNRGCRGDCIKIIHASLQITVNCKLFPLAKIGPEDICICKTEGRQKESKRKYPGLADSS